MLFDLVATTEKVVNFENGNFENLKKVPHFQHIVTFREMYECPAGLGKGIVRLG
jgi:hypothetical protein